MSRLVWDQIGEHFYETGVDQGVLYLLDAQNAYSTGVAWNGLTSVSESPSGAEATKLYADNIKYLNLISAEEFAATIECYTYPDEFMECNGEKELVAGVVAGQQARKSFGLSYRTQVGNDTKGSDYGYKIHLIYGCLASPSDRSYSTINDSPDAITFSYEINTTPVDTGVEGFKPTSCIVIDSRDFTTEAAKAKLTAFEAVIYGGENTTARLPLPSEVKSLLTVPAG